MAVLGVEPLGRVEPGRGVLAPPVPALVVAGVLLAGGDDEVAVAVEGGVVGTRGVVLALVVVDVVAGLQLPAAAVDRRASRSVEVVLEGDGLGAG
ncbi:hypothetical protein ACFQVA_37445 [Actinomadura keratinilytica]